MNSYVEIGINILESYLIFMFFLKYFTMKKTFTKINIAIATGVFATSITLINGYMGYDGAYSILNSLFVFFPFLYFFAKGSTLEKVYMSLFVVELISMLNTFIYILVSYLYYQKIDINLVEKEHYILLLILTKLLFLFISQFIAKVRRSVRSYVDNGKIVFFICTSLASTITYLFIESIVIEGIYDERKLGLSLIGILSVNVFVFIAFFCMQFDNDIILSSQLQIQYLEYQTKLVDASKASYQETSKLKHDMKHCLNYVNHLLEVGDSEGAKKEIQGYISKVSQLENVIFTENGVLNFILNTKYAKAKEKGIHVRFQINFKKKIEMDDMDISILLGNAFDNAIENTQKGEEIEIIIKEKSEMLLFVIKNPLSQKLIFENGEIATTKLEAGHGYGIPSIKEIAQKYNGNTQFDVKDDTFICKIIVQV